MASLQSRLNLAVTAGGGAVAAYILWQFLTIYTSAYRFQDEVSSISYRATEVQKSAEHVRKSVLEAASNLQLPVSKRDIEVFVAPNRVPQIEVHYEQPLGLLVTTAYVRCHVNTLTVDIWFSGEPEEQEEKPVRPTRAGGKRS